ncbi:MAG: hypothetical protein WCB02_21045, partial [Bradyrhizobium sp.]
VRHSSFVDRMDGRNWNPAWFLSMRDVTNATNERTAIFSVRPRLPSNDKLPSVFVRFPAPEVACLVANLSSFVFDYVARQKIGGTNLGGYIVEQLAVLPPNAFAQKCPWADQIQTVEDWILPRALELIYTAHDLNSFAEGCGFSGQPFTWDERRRFLLRCELDAAFFHLYFPSTPDGAWKEAERENRFAKLQRYFSTPRDAIAHVLDSFPGVRRKEEQTFGEFKTKQCVLDIYDSILTAIRLGRAYRVRQELELAGRAD